jgi:hypothetical protein
MRRFLEYIIVCVMVIISSSCNIDEEITTSLPPKIIIEGNGSYRVRLGDELRLAPRYENGDEATYSWSIEGVELGNEPTYTFTAQSKGTTKLLLTVSNISGSDNREFNITVIDKFMVYDYTPAPGQFIGDKYTATTPTEASTVALQRMQKSQYVSLGGFGGYIVVGFDHSITNGEGYDFAVGGNSFNSSSEPGIVWVMQDENGDGKPNDTWYELAGSETGKSTTIRNYAVTYYRPSGTGMSVQWVDSMGNSGVIAYLPTYHKQDYYYPEWITADSYTLRGTRLEARNYDKYGNGAMWIQPPYDWGYADNYSSVDRLAEGEGSESTAMPNGFDISNAINHRGEKIALGFVDFVKVQTACNTSSGWLGENSTEVFGIYEIK